MTFDVVILAYSISSETILLTEAALRSLRGAESTVKFHPVVVESGKFYPYNSTQIFYPREPFNYNRACNLALRYTKNPYILFCNNDIIFKPGFAEVMLREFEEGTLSLSPCSSGKPGGRKWGYRIGHNGEVQGWCIGIDRRLFTIIPEFDEGVDFWYSDHLYAEQLERNNIHHALVYGCGVYHLESRTLDSLCADENYDLTLGQHGKYMEASIRIREL